MSEPSLRERLEDQGIRADFRAAGLPYGLLDLLIAHVEKLEARIAALEAGGMGEK